MNYQEFVDFIYQRHSGNVKLGLDRMINILNGMGKPHLNLNGFHIAGTNGKGSTSAMCEAIALANGDKVGLNTSPHLVDYRERIRVDRNDITFEELKRVYTMWGDLLEENEASFFEITTAMAFYYFLEQKIDTAIMEVGLGGRLDGTNPFIPTVSAITTIAIDHPKSLGGTIDKIAFEKAGIIKSEVPVVVGKMPELALGVILGKAIDKNAPTFVYGRDFEVKNIRLKTDGTHFDYYFKEKNIELINIKTNMLGEHQAYNASVAITSSILYQEKRYGKVNLDAILKGLNSVVWMGRMQILQENPLILIDGAHNEQAVDFLVANISEIFTEKFNTVLAILRDKDFDEMIGKIASVSNKLYITQNTSKRAAEINDQMSAARKTSIPAESFDDIKTALDKAINESNGETPILVTGSLYTISEVIREFKKI